MMKIQIKLTTSQVTEHAMLMQGISPKTMSLKPGTRRHKSNHKAAQKQGYSKHRGRQLD